MDTSEAIRILRFAISFTSITSNVLILTAVLGTKHIRCHLCNMFIAGNAVGDISVGLGLLVKGIFVEYNLAVVGEIEKLECLLAGTVLTFSLNFCQVSHLFVALDRLISAHSAGIYSKVVAYKLRYFYGSFSICWAISIGACFAQLIGFENGVTDICLQGKLWGDVYKTYWLVFPTLMSTLIAVVSGLTVIRFRQNASFASTSTQRSFHATMAAILFSYLVLFCFPNFIYFFAVCLQADPVLLANVSLFMSLGAGAHSSTNVCLYVWRHKEIRNALLRQFCCDKRALRSKTIPTSKSLRLRKEDASSNR